MWRRSLDLQTFIMGTQAVETYRDKTVPTIRTPNKLTINNDRRVFPTPHGEGKNPI